MTVTESRSIIIRKRRKTIRPVPSHILNIEFIIWKKNTFFMRDTASIPDGGEGRVVKIAPS